MLEISILSNPNHQISKSVSMALSSMMIESERWKKYSDLIVYIYLQTIEVIYGGILAVPSQHAHLGTELTSWS